MSNTTKKPLLIIAGPTASGKSAAALQIAQTCNGTIINADSLQVYDGLPTLTAQPDTNDNTDIPHELYACVSVTDAYDVHRWLVDVEKTLRSIPDDQTPILVGGTGFYLSAFCYGIAPIPAIPIEIRSEIQQYYLTEGPNTAHQRLTTTDPALASRLHPNDQQRIIRALSVHKATGKPLSWWQDQEPEHALGEDYAVSSCIILPPRDVLRSRAEKRFHSMIAKGAVDEVKALREQTPPEQWSPTLLKAIGVRPALDYLNGACTKDEMIAKSIHHTHQYLKRQTTWFTQQPLPYANHITTDPLASLVPH